MKIRSTIAMILEAGMLNEAKMTLQVGTPTEASLWNLLTIA